MLEDGRYALFSKIVVQILRAVEITPLPRAPEIVLGIINLHGQLVPVLNIRQRFRLRTRELALSDQLIVSETRKRRVALLVDRVPAVDYYPGPLDDLKSIVPGSEYIQGIAKLPDGLILVHDLMMFA